MVEQEQPKGWGVIPASIEATRLPAIAESVRSLLMSIAEPFADEIGLLLAQGVATFRLRNQVRMLEKTQRICDAAGIEPRSIPLRTLAPLLEGASWEDEESLQDMWASLLAAAARDPAAVPPAFASIMKGLSPSDARFLQAYFVSDGHVDGGGVSPELHRTQSESWRAQQMSIDNLTRLGLISYDAGGRRVTEHSLGQVLSVLARGHRSFDPDEHVEHVQEWVSLTSIGEAFLTAAAPPE